jgi:hypothetical protein
MLFTNLILDMDVISGSLFRLGCLAGTIQTTYRVVRRVKIVDTHVKFSHEIYGQVHVPGDTKMGTFFHKLFH